MTAKYLVSWVCVEDRTWEPSQNLPPSMVIEYRMRFGIKKQSHLKQLIEQASLIVWDEGPMTPGMRSKRWITLFKICSTTMSHLGGSGCSFR